MSFMSFAAYPELHRISSIFVEYHRMFMNFIECHEFRRISCISQKFMTFKEFHGFLKMFLCPSKTFMNPQEGFITSWNVL